MDIHKEAIHAFNMQASLYNERFTGFDLYNDTYDILCELVKKQGAHILELACGPGNITKYLITKRPDFQILATDMAPEMLKFGRENCPAAEFKILDCRNLQSLSGQYDAILCGFGMPYLNKEECQQLIREANEKLHKGGVFYFSLIEGKYEQSGHLLSSNGKYRSFVHYYSEEDVCLWFKPTYLRPLPFIRKTYNIAGKEPAQHLIVIAVKEKS